MIEFSFTLRDNPPPPSGFDLGDMEVTGSSGRASSRGHDRDQGMMIHLSVAGLLDGLRSLLERGSGTVEFVAADSSFALRFTLRRGVVTTRYGKAVIDVSPAAEVAAAAYSAAASFASRELPRLPADDAGRQDLEEALSAFAPLVPPSSRRPDEDGGAGGTLDGGNSEP